MIVTCPACSSRYKLDESKVTGRGAKITCPKCKHAFVVYPGGTTGALPDTPPKPAPPVEPPDAGATQRFTGAELPRSGPNLAAAAPPVAPSASGSAWEEEPTRLGGAADLADEDTPVPNAVLRRPSGGTPNLAAPSAPPAGVPNLAAPAAPPAASPAASASLPLPVAGEDSSEVFQITPAAAAARSPTLDFKKVGVATWKVKIKIGLIYDFSDIKTLRKYIQDGRVTQADVISYDGKIWKSLGEIPDLDVFFVQTWEELNRALPRDATGEVIPPAAPKRPVEEPKPEPPKTPSPSTTPFKDPFAQRSTPAKKATTPAPAVAGTSNSLLARAGVLVLLLVGAAGAYMALSGQEASAPPPAAAPVKPAADAGDPDKARAEIKKQLANSLQPVESAPAFDPEADLNGNGIPDGKEPKAPIPGKPVRPPPGEPPQPGTPVAGQPKPPAPPTPNAPSQSASDASGADYAAAADGEARSGNWSKAVQGYQQAVALEPSNGTYLRKLGEAQYKSGDADAARGTLVQAASKGQKSAYKTLGQICKEQGDTTGASSFYQKYLATNPPDAAEIQAVLATLNGG